MMLDNRTFVVEETMHIDFDETRPPRGWGEGFDVSSMLMKDLSRMTIQK